jgi:mono/diheme cytochrome c family protein
VKEMMMRKFGMFAAAAVFSLAAAVLYTGFASAEEAAAPDGKAIFLAQKCNMCHSVPTVEITRTTKSEKIAGQDLMTHDMEAEQLTKFIKKEVKNNEDKMHGKEFKGTEEELKTLVDWLLANKRPEQ